MANVNCYGTIIDRLGRITPFANSATTESTLGFDFQLCSVGGDNQGRIPPRFWRGRGLFSTPFTRPLSVPISKRRPIDGYGKSNYGQRSLTLGCLHEWGISRLFGDSDRLKRLS